MVTPVRSIMPTRQAGGSIDLYRRGMYDPTPDGGQMRTMPVGRNFQSAPMNQYGSINMAATSGMRQDVMPRQTMQTMRPTGFTPEMQAQQAPTPQYGLAGSEAALQAGLGGGLAAIEQGYGQAMGNVNRGIDLAQNAAQLGAGSVAGGVRSALASLNQANRMAQGAFGGGGFGAGAGNAQASQANVNTGQDLFSQAASGVGQFTDAGVQAQQQQLALSGALGQDAFNQALLSNPGTDLLKKEAMNAVLNQAAATGGLGSGNVLKALQDRATGLAAQDLQNQYNRAAGLSQQGLQAAGQQGQFLSQAGQQMGQLAGQNAQLGTQASIANAGNQTQASIASANNALQAANTRANLAAQLGMAGAGYQNQAGMNTANLLQNAAGQGVGLLGQAAGYANQGGMNAANMFGQTGGALANARMQAGQQMAGNIGNTNAAIANLINQQGSGLSDLIGQGGVNIANLISGAGQSLGGNQMTLAQLLANLSTGQGTQLAGLQGAIGQAQAGGLIGGAAGLRSGLGQLGGGIAQGLASSGAGAGLGSSILSGLGAFLSDDRLKTDIKKVGEEKGFNIYEWAWNGLLGLTGKARGVLSSEVIMKRPDAVIHNASGYNKINYLALGIDYAAI